MTECNEQPVINWLQFAHIADFARSGWRRKQDAACERDIQLCAAYCCGKWRISWDRVAGQVLALTLVEG